MAVYTKNFYIKGVGTIGGKEVTAAIDKVLDNALPAGKKATDYHSQEPKPKKEAPKKAPSKKSE